MKNQSYPTVHTSLIRLTFSLIAALMLSGCTVLGALGGAAVDVIVVTVPIWGPTAVESERLNNFEDERDKIPSPDPGSKHASKLGRNLFIYDSTTSLTLAMGPMDVEGSSDHGSLYKAWLLLPLMPYYMDNRDYGLSRKELEKTYTWHHKWTSEEQFIPMESFPEVLRWEADSEPSPLALQYAKLLATTDTLTLSDELRHAMIASAGESKVEYTPGTTMEAKVRHAVMERTKLTVPYTVRASIETPEITSVVVSKSETSGAGIHLSRDRNLTAKLSPLPESELPDGTIVLGGSIGPITHHRSHILYGLTIVGSNLLSIVGLPTSRCYLEYNGTLTARIAGTNEVLLSREIKIESLQKSIGLWYGKEASDRAYEDLNMKLDAEVAAFADDLAAQLPN